VLAEPEVAVVLETHKPGAVAELDLTVAVMAVLEMAGPIQLVEVPTLEAAVVQVATTLNKMVRQAVQA
jgi:hypothetical protein